MPDILDTILAVKRREVADLAPRLADLKAAAGDTPPPRGFARTLRRKKASGTFFAEKVPDTFFCIRIIAEVKHRSPSAGVLIDPFVPADVARRYADAGAEAISCLTDREFFGGAIEHLRQVRAAVGLPVVRKDFIIAPVQVYEARAAGADAILLIAEALGQAEMTDLAGLAGSFGMDVLAEAHGEAAVEKAISSGAACVGINNRDLATFKIDLATSERLAPAVLAAGRVLVAESGIKTGADVKRLLVAGADAILVGEGLLKSGDIAAKLAEFKSA